MFKRICIPPKYPEQVYFDLGLLAESLLFYREVIIIVRYSSLKGLLEQCDPETIIRLLEKGRLKIKYVNNFLGAISQGENTPMAQYDIGLVSSERHRLFNASQEIFQNIIGKKGKGRRTANKFVNYVEEIAYDSNITKQIRDELFDGRYIQNYIAKRIEKMGLKINASELENLVFKFGNLVGKGYTLETNLDFNLLSKFPNDRTITKPSVILSNYCSTIADLSLWSRYDTEVAVNSNQADALQYRFSSICEKSKSTVKNISNFQEFVFDNSKAIREAINSGKRSLTDLETILDKSEKFSDWLQNKDPDANLLKEYFREITSGSWVDKLPSKMIRWALFTGAGFTADGLGAGGIGTLAGLTLSVLDGFLVDKIIKGWKPNQFIQGTLDEFVK